MTSAMTSARLAIAAVIALGAALAPERAEAYPQFQMSRDQTCTGCHILPAGGGILNENGEVTSEGISTWGTSGAFLNGAFDLPAWLALGADFRNAAGYIRSPEDQIAIFPMQYEANAQFKLGAGVSVYVTGGLRSRQEGNEGTTFAWSREHFVMWQQKPDENTGLYVRAGRFMPVFGQRLVEHPAYTRKWGGTALYADTYGVSASYIDPKYEAHVSAFIEDPLIDTPEHSDGGAAVGEYRLSERLSLGVEGMYTKSPDDQKIRVGALAKYHIPEWETLLQFEGQFMNQLIEPDGAPKQLLGYLMASKMVAPGFMLDLGLGYFNENVRIARLHREAVDLNLHWFATSHIEALFTGRLELLALGDGGPTAGYALLQIHYRL